MARLRELLDRLWDDYAGLNPQAKGIHDLLTARGETIINDHIAFRTYDDPRIGIDALAHPFVELGYEPKGGYTFPEKKLLARHYEPGPKAIEALGPAAKPPKVFISELQVSRFSDDFGGIVKGLIDQVPGALTRQWDLPVSGRPWEVSYADYETLRTESEYGAWLAAFGFCANHFTINVGALSSFESLEQFNRYIAENGYELNTSGGEIKGSPAVYLEQSSTLAAQVPVAFTDGTHTIPCCYYEFARRHTMPDGQVFEGFVAKSADKIFESTDRRD